MARIGWTSKANGESNGALQTGGEANRLGAEMADGAGNVPLAIAAGGQFQFDYIDSDTGFSIFNPGSVFDGVTQRLQVNDTDDNLLEPQDNAEATALNDPFSGGTGGFETGETVAYFGTATTTFANGDVATLLLLSNSDGSDSDAQTGSSIEKGPRL